MGFRFQKRIDLGKGIGLNVSKSGVRPSMRTKGGTIGTKGFSIKTGIPGVNYRKSYTGCLVTLFLIFMPVLLFLLK
jgi:hypothetical protein